MQDLIIRTRISKVFEALGGTVRNRRGKAFWRDGKNLNVFIDDDKGWWKDYARNECGGIIHLICRALDCDRKTAAQWLSDFHGVPLDSGTRTDPHQYRAACRDAAAVIAWRDDLLARLRGRRDIYFAAYHRTLQQVLAGPPETPLGEMTLDACEAYERRYLELDRHITTLEQADRAVLAEMYRASVHQEAA